MLNAKVQKISYTEYQKDMQKLATSLQGIGMNCLGIPELLDIETNCTAGTMSLTFKPLSTEKLSNVLSLQSEKRLLANVPEYKIAHAVYAAFSEEKYGVAAAHQLRILYFIQIMTIRFQLLVENRKVAPGYRASYNYPKDPQHQKQYLEFLQKSWVTTLLSGYYQEHAIHALALQWDRDDEQYNCFFHFLENEVVDRTKYIKFTEHYDDRWKGATKRAEYLEAVMCNTLFCRATTSMLHGGSTICFVDKSNVVKAKFEKLWTTQMNYRDLTKSIIKGEQVKFKIITPYMEILDTLKWLASKLWSFSLWGCACAAYDLACGAFNKLPIFNFWSSTPNEVEVISYLPADNKRRGNEGYDGGCGQQQYQSARAYNPDRNGVDDGCGHNTYNENYDGGWGQQCQSADRTDRNGVDGYGHNTYNENYDGVRQQHQRSCSTRMRISDII